MREENVLRKVSWSALIISVLTGAFGCALILYPEEVRQMLAVILSACAVLLGVYHLILYFVSQRKKSMLATDLFTGVILILLGAFMYIQRAQLFNYITVIFGLILLVDCILEIQNAIFVKRLGFSSGWLLPLFFGLISLVFAVLMTLRPDFIQNELMLISGIFLVIAGVTGVVTFIQLRVVMHKAKKAAKDAAAAANAVDVDYEEVPEEEYSGRNRSDGSFADTEQNADQPVSAEYTSADADGTAEDANYTAAPDKDR